MPIIRVTKRFHFEMAHILYGYDGLCSNIHGHSYYLEITLSGEPLKAPGHPKDGMVLDFGDLKQLVKNEIINRFDHALMVNRIAPDDQLRSLEKSTERIILVDFQPTSENIAAFIASILQKKLPSYASLYSVRLYETVTSYAEWFAADNP